MNKKAQNTQHQNTTLNYSPAFFSLPFASTPIEHSLNAAVYVSTAADHMYTCMVLQSPQIWNTLGMW